MSNLVQAAEVFNINVPEWLRDDDRVGELGGVKIYAGELRRLNKAIADLKETDVEEANPFAGLSNICDDSHILSLLHSHKIIEAIGYRRGVSGERLKQAKDYVEDIGVRHGLRKMAPSQFYPHVEVMTWV